MTEEQKEVLRDCNTLLEDTKFSGTAKWLRFQFPEAFAEPKPERQSIDVRIEKNKSLSVLSENEILECLTSRIFWLEEAELTVTELPAPEGNGWTDELVREFVRNVVSENFLSGGESLEQRQTRFKAKHNIK